VISAALSQSPKVTAKVDAVEMLDAAYSMSAHVGQWQTIAKAAAVIKSDLRGGRNPIGL